MKNKLGFKSMKTRLTCWFFIVALLPLITIIIINGFQRVNAIKKREFNKLTAIRDLKANQVNEWLNEKIGDIKTISTSFILREYLENISINKDRPINNKNDIIKLGKERLKSFFDNYKDYYNIYIIDPISKKIVLSINETMEQQDVSRDPQFSQLLKSTDIYISDIHFSKIINRPSMTFSIPIRCLYHNGKHIVGILVTEINLDKTLYNLLLDRTGMGETGETLIVDSNATALTELRWHKKAPLKLKIKAKPSILASQGETDIIEAMDYRDEKVLAAYTYIPRTKWGFITKQDQKEIYKPIRLMLINILILLSLSIIIVYLISFLVSRKITMPIIEMSKVAEKIQKGNFSIRNNIITKDELSILALSFNKMANSMESRINVEEGISELNKIMIFSNKLSNFSNELIKKLLEKTNSNLGVFYLLNEAGDKFEHLTSIGANPELFEKFDAKNCEAGLGQAIAKKEIFHEKDIPKDTIYKYRTIAGTAICREIITIPVLVNDKVIAIISLASINKYSDECLAIVNQIRIGINIAFSNIIANEKTRHLLDEINIKNDELQIQAEELKASNEELKFQAEEIKAQKHMVEEATKLKSEFLSNMSHELRTPLNSILVLSQGLLSTNAMAFSKKEKEYIEIIERNGRNLLKLINDILDISKIEVGKIDINNTYFQLKELIEAGLSSIRPLAEEKKLKINYSIAKNIPMIYSDLDKLKQVFINITGNAIKFTEKGSITIDAGIEEKQVYIKISDTGIGIKEEYLTNIFDEFRQVDGTTTRKFEGTGLGLSISKKLMNLIDGDIIVQSTYGKGSNFTMIFPFETMAEIKQEIVNNSYKYSIESTKKTILIIEDEPKSADIISDYLTKQDYNTIITNNGKKAIELAKKIHPYAITLDVIMPEMDGWEVLSKLKQLKETMDIPVIIISISDDAGTGFALGASGYLIKPVYKEQLLSEINKIKKFEYVKTIMIVDDKKVERDFIEKILKEQGYNTISIENGKKALEELTTTIPDILLLDLLMPGMDGFDVLEDIRKREALKNLAVIIITAKDLTKKEKDFLHKKANDIIIKSGISKDNILNTTKKILKKFNESYETEKVLLVEDNKDAVIQIIDVMEEIGINVEIAYSGKEALEKIDSFIPTGVILDLMMPGIDGFEVLKSIRLKHQTRTIPILILTAKELTKEDYMILKTNNIQQLIIKGSLDRKELKFKIENLFKTSMTSMNNKKSYSKSVIEYEKTDEQSDFNDSKINGNEKENKFHTKKKILIIEDNLDNLTSLKFLLEGLNCKIISATEGVSGFKKAISEDPDIILLDMQLPIKNGFKIVKEFKENDKLKDIPVIAITAMAMKRDRERIIKAGCNDYLSKPMEKDTLIEVINKYIR